MPFWRLTLSVSPETADSLTNFLWERGALGVVEEERPGGPDRLTAFFPETASSTALLRAVGAYRASLAVLGLDHGPAEPEVTAVQDEPWASAWQQSFPPREVGRRLMVLPPWAAHGAPPPGRVPIVIEPGRAFGTGHHGSTEGCLVLLDEALDGAPGGRALDIGTGTGILAIAAVKLGAAGALALDVDPDAVAAAATNAERNACAARIQCRVGGAEEAGEERFALVLANLLGPTHLALRDRYRRLLAPGGRLVLGGMLAREEDEVAAACAAAGLTPRARLIVEGWAALRLDAA